MAYNVATKTWTLNGTSFAPGIIWFEGNLTMGNGVYYGSFIATGTISTAGSLKIYAVNFAGYNGKRGTTTYAPTGICVNSYFPGLYPTDYCGADGSAFTSPNEEGARRAGEVLSLLTIFLVNLQKWNNSQCWNSKCNNNQKEILITYRFL